MPYRMTPSVRHRAIEVHYYYYYYYPARAVPAAPGGAGQAVAVPAAPHFFILIPRRFSSQIPPRRWTKPAHSSVSYMSSLIWLHNPL